MYLLDIPAELRLQIYSHLSDLTYGTSERHETIGPNVRLTPPISRASHILRRETLPLYAKTSSFIIHTDDNLHSPNNRVHIWLRALGAVALAKVERLQLSRHWKIKQPSRWQGHVGFYIRLQLIDGEWQCTVGTYPFAGDVRGMRLDSVGLMSSVILARLHNCATKGLNRANIEFVLDAMEVVASHPIPPFDTEQGEDLRGLRVWCDMHRELASLPMPPAEAELADIALAEGTMTETEVAGLI